MTRYGANNFYYFVCDIIYLNNASLLVYCIYEPGWLRQSFCLRTLLEGTTRIILVSIATPNAARHTLSVPCHTGTRQMPTDAIFPAVFRSILTQMCELSLRYMVECVPINGALVLNQIMYLKMKRKDFISCYTGLLLVQLLQLSFCLVVTQIKKKLHQISSGNYVLYECILYICDRLEVSQKIVNTFNSLQDVSQLLCSCCL